MEIQTQLIVDLHKIDKRLNQIEEGKGDLPSQIQELQDKLNSFKEIVTQSNDDVQDLEKEKNNYSVNIEEFKAKLEKYNNQIFQVKNNEEYDALLVEIDYIKNQNQEILDKINQIDQKITDNQETKKNTEESIESAESNLAKAQDELKVASESSAKEEQELASKKTKILSQIADSLTGESFLAKYKDSSSNPIIESMSRGSCNNCYSALPAQLVFDIQKGEKLIPCPACGIYLYYDENEEE